VLRRLRRRGLADAALEWVLRAAVLAGIVVAAIVGWSHLTPDPAAGDQVLVAVAAAAGAAGVAWALTRPDLARVARIADARLSLDERLASALAFSGDTSDLSRRLQDDAAVRGAAVGAGEVYPLKRHWMLAMVAAGCVIAAVIVSATPNPQSGALRRMRADHAAVSRARVAVAKQLQAAQRSPGSEALQQALRQAELQLRGVRTPLQALASLSLLTQRLSELNDPLAASRAAASMAAGRVLAANLTTAAAARPLASGDAGVAASALDQLGRLLSGLSAGERAGLARGLQQASSAAAANPALSTALSSAAKGVESGQVDAAATSLSQAGRAVVDASSAASMEQQVRAAEAAAANAESAAGSQATTDASGQGQGGGQGQGLSGQGQGQGQAGQGQGQGQGGRGQGQGQGQAGQGQGQGQGGRGQGQGGQGQGQGVGNQGGDGSRGGIGAASQQVYVGGQPGADATNNNPQPLGPGQAVNTTGYHAVLSEFEPVALQSLGRTVVYPLDQELVREYFADLGQP
jgi:hypothetical protein